MPGSQKSTKESPLITTREACQLLDCHPNTLRRWEKSGLIKSVRLGKRGHRKYKKEEVLKILHEVEKSENINYSEEKYRLLVNNSQDFITVYSKDGENIYISPSVKHLLGYSQEERIGRNILKDAIVHPKDIGRLKTAFQSVIKRPEITEKIEVRLKNKNGYWKVLEAVFQNYLHNPIISGIVANFWDITDRKKLIEDLKAQRELMDKYLSATDIFFLILNRNKKVQLINKKGASLLGYKEEEIIGQDWFNNYLPKRIIKDTKRVYHKLISGNVKNAEYYENPILTKSGEERIIAWHNSLIKNSKGQVTTIVCSGEDITKKKESEENLRESEERYRAAFNNVGLGIVEVDQKDRILTANKRFCEILGYECDDELIGKSIHQITALEDRPVSDKNNEKIHKGIVDSLDYEKRYLKKDGSTVWVHVTVSAIHDLNGNPIRSIGTVEDISDRKKYLESLEESEERFRTLANNMSQLVWMAHKNGDIFWYNNRWYDYTGTTYEEMKEWGWQKVCHPDHLNRVVNKIKQCFKTGEIWEDTYPLRGKHGNYQWFLSRAVPIKNDKGKIIQWFGTNTDITEQLRIENALKENTERLLLAQKAGRVGIFEWDIKNNIERWSPELEELYGIPRGSFGGRYEDWIQLINPEDVDKVEADIKKSLETGEYASEWRVIYYDRSVHWLQGRGQVFFDKNGNPDRMIGANTDITELKRLEQQKDEFLAIASHELKTPITSIKAYGQVLQQLVTKNGDKKYLDILKRMDGQINRLTNLILDLLDVTRLQAGKLQFREDYFEFNDLVEDTVNDIRPTALGHSLIIELSSPVKVYGDRDRIGQVITNLLSNAVKYSPEADKVIIKSYKDTGNIILSVKDFGVGIDKEKQGKIFDRFYRAEGDKEEVSPGLGLGLFISSEIIRRQGGKLWLKSEVGKGSTFYFSLPIKPKDIIQKEKNFSE